MAIKPSVALLFEYLNAAGIDTTEDRTHGVIADVTIHYPGSGEPVEITVTRVSIDTSGRNVDWSEVHYVPAGERPRVESDS